MISSSNPVGGMPDPRCIDCSGLMPRIHTMPNGQPVACFYDNHLDMVRIDVSFEAGTALQHKLLQAGVAVRLITEGTRQHSAAEIAEFIDFHGIVVERNIDSCSAGLSLYVLTRYAHELLPLLRELLTEATFPQSEFDLYMAKRHQNLLTNFQKTAYVARNQYYAHLYGPQHPNGRYALPDDTGRLTVDDVRQFFADHYRLGEAQYVLSGNITDELLALFDATFGDVPYKPALPHTVPPPAPADPAGLFNFSMPGAVQHTLRVGRLLPFGWDSVEYAHFMVLTTLLGGYFGSRLMSNIREDKGYTYGVNAATQLMRGSMAFYIVTDVAGDKAMEALGEIRHEIARLCDEPVPDEELQLVRSYIVGDFMRSIDGIFERAERYRMMCSAQVTEQFTTNLLAALTPDDPRAATPASLQQLARQLLSPDQLLEINVGA